MCMRVGGLKVSMVVSQLRQLELFPGKQLTWARELKACCNIH